MVIGRVASQGKEHLVEAGPAEGELGHGDVGAGQLGESLTDRVGVATRADSDVLRTMFRITTSAEACLEADKDG